MYEHDETKYAADCGSLVVPENRRDPGSMLTALPLIKICALNDIPAEPIFWLAVGLGEYSMPPGLVGLIENHNIVMVGYRGADGSVVLGCPEMTRAAKGLGGDMLNEASLAHFGEATILCAGRLKSEGVDLVGYSIPEFSEDMDAARAALGYER